MSVVTSVTATPNRLYAVWELLDRSPRGMVQAEIAGWVTPSSLARARGDGDEEARGAILDGVLQELVNLQVCERGEGGRLALTAQARQMTAEQKYRFVEERIVHPQHAESSRQGQVGRALAWLLTRDPRTPLPWQGGLRSEVEGDCGLALDLTDAARSQQFVYWARHLGFAWRLRVARDSSGVVVIDPTKAVRRHLPQAIDPLKQVPIEEALRSLAERLPVIDGGVLRGDIEARLSQTRSPRNISRSSSLAFLSLEQSQEIRIDNLSDAPSMELDDGTTVRPVSHVTWMVSA